jgi:hypothetical protein
MPPGHASSRIRFGAILDIMAQRTHSVSRVYVTSENGMARGRLDRDAGVPRTRPRFRPVGHLLAMGAAVLPFTLLGLYLEQLTATRVVAALSLVGFGVYKLVDQSAHQ